MKKIIRFLKNHKLLILGTISFLLFLLVLNTVLFKTNIGLDNKTISFMNSIRNTSLTNITKVLTNLGGTICLIVIAVICLIFTMYDDSDIYVVLNLGLATLASELLKYLVHRGRPLYMLITQTGYSFPSGHAMVSVAFYGFLIYLVYRYVRRRCTRRMLYILLSTVIFVICFSRLYLGAHFMTDVLGGIFAGITYLCIFIHFYKKFV